MNEISNGVETFYDLEVELSRIISLTRTIYEGYFGYSSEKAQELTHSLIPYEYEKNADLISISLGLMLDMKKTVAQVQRCYEPLDEDPEVKLLILRELNDLTDDQLVEFLKYLRKS